MECTECGFTRPVHNSCRNRHCPKCQALAQASWIARRAERLLPTAAFHVVFTAPDSLRLLALDAPAEVYAILLRAAAEALCSLGADPRFYGGKLGVTAVLHTWTRDLRLHPHVHCIVPAGALDLDRERWVAARQKFLIPLAVLSSRFRSLACRALERRAQAGTLDSRLHPLDLARRLRHLRSTRWNTYAKRSFGSPLHILHYLGRYTHRVAISNTRVLAIDHDRITFRTRHANSTTLPRDEFLRRFLLHVLPPGFHKIRHFGLLGSRHVSTLLPLAERCIRGQGLAIEIEPAPAAALLRSEANADIDDPSHCTTDPPRHSEPSALEVLQALTDVPTRCPACGAHMLARPLDEDRSRSRGPPP